MSKRKSPDEIIHALMDTLDGNYKTVQDVSKAIGSGWETTWKYLELIHWVQQCPKVQKEKITESIEAWRREWGKIPK